MLGYTPRCWDIPLVTYLSKSLIIPHATQPIILPLIIVDILLFIMKAYSGAVILMLGFAALANAHTTFTTLYVDRKSQGDGTCVRMPYDGETATFPIQSVISEDMACG
jgi:hypothetical protein